MKYDVIVIGAGAAGFFGAINIGLQNKNLKIAIVEKTSRVLHKVKISGGGRCNVTHACFDNKILANKYPRGYKELPSVFNIFSSKDIIEWFNIRGVELKVENDNRMFPISNSSQTIIDTLLNEASKLNIKIILEHEVLNINTGSLFSLSLFNRSTDTDVRIEAKKILIAIGGHPKIQNYEFIQKLGHTIIDPLPSLFTFNLMKHPITNLMGLSVPHVKIKIIETKDVEEGPLLITHWGLSGPAVIRLSAWVARNLYELDYNYTLSINWLPMLSREEGLNILVDGRDRLLKKKITSVCLFENIPNRLWHYIVELSQIDLEQRWMDLSQKEINRLIENLYNMTLKASGKTTYKDEFVISGGVYLKEINLKDMESKICSGVYFAGEVIDVDGITGGFNFQNAWSTSYIASQAIVKSLMNKIV